MSDKATKEVVMVSLAYRIRQLIAQHGGMRLAARAVGIDPGYLSRMMSGDKTAPSDATLKRLGLRKIVSYQSAHPQSGGSGSQTGRPDESGSGAP